MRYRHRHGTLGSLILGTRNHFKRRTADPLKKLVQQINQSGVDVVLDVGANVGHYGLLLRRFGWNGRIFSFEPLQEAYAQLERASRNDPLWSTFNYGLSDDRHDRIMHVTSNCQGSSSLHFLGHRHIEAAPEVQVVGNEVVRLRELDAIAEELPLRGSFFMKLDVQGHEMQVLKGAQETLLSHGLGVQVELSLLPLYGSTYSMDEIWSWLRSMRFAPTWAASGFQDRFSGELLQVDVAFFRDGSGK